MVPTQFVQRTRQYPWPLPNSAYQGAVGGAGGIGMVQVPPNPYYGPFQPYWPYAVPLQLFGGLPTNPLKM